MKIRFQLIVLLVIILAVVTGLTLSMKSSISKRNNILLTEELKSTKNTIEKKTKEIVNAKATNLLYNYTIWNQMADFLNGKKDTGWAKEELKHTFSQYGQIKYIWLLNRHFREAYFTTTAANLPAQSLDMKPGLLGYSLQSSPFRHFFINHNNALVEVFTAPVQSSASALQSTQPDGYIMIGSIVDAGYLAGLNDWEKDIKFSLANTGGEENIFTEGFAPEKGILRFSVPLKDISDNTIAAFNVEKKFPLLISHQNYVNSYLLAFILIITVIAGICYFSIKKLVILPLKQLNFSLREKKTDNLVALNGAKTEFGELSRLITNFFEQNRMLGEEIEYRKKSEEKLQASLKETEAANAEKSKAEESARAKAQFLSVMSHEIRTPINGVIGIANLLKEENLTKQQQEYITTLSFSAEHLLSLVSDILDFSKIEAGGLHFEKTSFSLEKLCRSTFDLFKNKAAEKGLNYVFNPAELKNYSIHGDSTRLSQVLANLLSNAIKFTEKGSVELSYSAIETNNHYSKIEFIVKDTGIGIAPDKLSKVFESFAQADDSVTRRYGGTGLGLTISKKIVELQGGHIRVESTPGKGSSFIFLLTFDNHVYADKELYEKNIGKKDQKELPGMKILVAEDNPVNAMVLTRFLSKWKIESEVAKDGAEAVSMMNDGKYDMVLMDLQMPNVDGVEATRIIRTSETENKKQVPIVAFTADALVETHQKLLQIGFDHCITKPFNPEQLFRYLQKHYAKAS